MFSTLTLLFHNKYLHQLFDNYCEKLLQEFNIHKSKETLTSYIKNERGSNYS